MPKIVFFDTSVLVAALVASHPHHERALPWLKAHETKLDAMTSEHALLELWSVLTRLPSRPLLAPAAAEQMVGRLASKIKVFEVTAGIHRRAIRRATGCATRSGAVFDALHLVTAEEAGADALLTFNLQDFKRLASPGGPEIMLPPDPPRVSLR